MATGTTGTVAWVVVTLDDLYSRLVAAQADALRNAALSQGQANTTNDSVSAVFDSVMPDVTARIRQYIVSNPRNVLSQTEYSVPPECKWMAIWLTLQDMIARLSIALPLNDDQRKQIDSANSDLDKLRQIQPPWLLISAPDDPEENPAMTMGPRAEIVRSSTRLYSRCTLKGL